MQEEEISIFFKRLEKGFAELKSNLIKKKNKTLLKALDSKLDI